MNIFIQLLINGLAVVISTYVLPGVHVISFWNAIVVGVVLGIVNAVVKPILIILTLPINIMTLGLFTLIINGLMVLVTSKIVPGFYVDSFGWAVLFSVVMWLVNSFLRALTK